MISHKAFEVLVDLWNVISFFDVRVVQRLSRLQKVSQSSARHSVPMALTCDDAVFALLRQLGLWMWKLVQLESFGNHFHFFIIA